MTEMMDTIIFVGFWRPPPSPDATILNYLNDRELGEGITFCKVLAPPSHDATILNYLNDRKKGRHYLLYDFGAPQCPPPDATILNYLNDRGGGAPFSFVGLILATPPSLDQTILINDLNNSRERGWGANILEEVKYITILLLIL